MSTSEQARLRQMAFADQLDAAEQDAAVAATAAMAARGGVAVVLPPGSRWYEQAIVDKATWRLRDDPDARFCPHVVTASVVWMALVPGVPVGCAECFDWWQQTQVAGSAEDRTCDLCRKVRPEGLIAATMNVRFPGDGSVPGVVAVVQFGVCEPCWAKDPT